MCLCLYTLADLCGPYPAHRRRHPISPNVLVDIVCLVLHVYIFCHLVPCSVRIIREREREERQRLHCR